MALFWGGKNEVMEKSNLQKNWEADQKLAREMKMEKFKQAGALALEDRAQMGQTERTGMDNAGRFNVENRNQLGQTERTMMDNAGNFAIHRLRDSGETARSVLTEKGLNERQNALIGQRKSEFDRSQGLEEYKAFDVTDDFGTNRNDPSRAAGFAAWMDRGKYKDRLSRIPVPAGNAGLAPSHSKTQTLSTQNKPVPGSEKPFGADLLQSNFGTYSGLRGLAYLNDRVINEPLRQTWNAAKTFGNWLTQRNKY